MILSYIGGNERADISMTVSYIEVSLAGASKSMSWKYI